MSKEKDLMLDGEVSLPTKEMGERWHKLRRQKLIEEFPFLNESMSDDEMDRLIKSYLEKKKKELPANWMEQFISSVVDNKQN